ncbi:hypothetical protein [Herbaspirillum sp. CF444]|uniref:hypothetical protein n=1 Tax=Herbaspirillum sp. CF444 TaxID=1144319 RepID=UPI0012F82A65|nr:hypothetical protein [Herbaspirillum sp. CF444]
MGSYSVRRNSIMPTEPETAQRQSREMRKKNASLNATMTSETLRPPPISLSGEAAGKTNSVTTRRVAENLSDKRSFKQHSDVANYIVERVIRQNNQLDQPPSIM